MKVALVHDHILEFGGAERVCVALKRIFPKADVYLAAYSESVVQTWIPDFDTWNVRTSWVARIPFYNRLYSPLRFLAPWIWESFDFSAYDLVISSSGWFMSKGIMTKPTTRHISYIHHPPSYLYYYQTAVEWQKYLLVKLYAHLINHFLRMWDFASSQRPDVLVANSVETQRRIEKFYRRDSSVIYPPVDIPEKEPSAYDEKNIYYVTLSRLAFKKHVDVLIRAANIYGFTLKVIGTGRDEAYLRSLAGPTVELCGRLSDEELASIYAGAYAFLIASEDEEFGIAPVEAMGHGVPVIAYASGGLQETVQDGHNGFLYKELSEENISEMIYKIEHLPREMYNAMRNNARSESKKYTFSVFSKHVRDLARVSP